MDKRRIETFFLIGLILGSAGIVAALSIPNCAPISDGITVSSADNMQVTVNGDTCMDLENAFPDAQTVSVTTDAGNVTFSSGDIAQAEIHKDDITGTWTTVTGLWATGDDITINPEDKESVTVGKDIESIEFTSASNVNTDDGTVDFSYGAIGEARVGLSGVPTNSQIVAIDANSGNVLDYASSDSSGDVTFNNLDSGDHDVRLQAVDPSAPILSNATPDEDISSEPDQISVDVSDADFPQDNVSVAINFEGDQIHNEYVQSNTTVTTTNFDANELGETYSWSVTATDQYGETASESHSFSLPSNITFRNETRPTEILTGKNATLTFYTVDGERVITREDTDGDGNITLQGLPDTEFVVAVQSDGFYERRVYVESIFEQNTIYLLNSTAYPNAVFTEFELDDRTGNFPPGETTLRVQRALDVNGDGESEWQTVAGDYFGATNRFPFTGEYQTRYRLVVENDEGDRRVLGSYTPTADGVRPVPIGEVTFSSDLESGTAFQASLNEQNGHNYIEVNYLDTAATTESLTYNIVRSDNESHVLLANTTETDIEREYVALHNMSVLDPGAPEDQGYKINYYAERTDENVAGETFAGDVMNFDFALDGMVQSLLAWTFIIAFAGITALYNPKMSMLTTPIVALAFTITGIMNIPSVLLALALVEGGLIYFGDTTSPR